ncbi:acylamino-acid-releasing enzyme-like [Pollicipes pollicipes]|uniref:acylamino-acid-releasing enzyme-like n=1 Tax=Pollicipes pollicipes TaxID=41117 RepID=UPI0018855D4C|nr:acylamino-acid-releasing enzyme-like [Pollicipes pollicipes]
MSPLLEAIVKRTRVLTKIPDLQQATVSSSEDGDFIKLQTMWSQSLVETAESVKFERTFVLDAATLKPVYELPPHPIGQDNVVCYSPSQKRKAVFRKKGGDGKKDQWLLDIWSDNHLSHVFDLAAMDKHGPICASGDFSSFQWSPDENQLLYVAERRRPPATSFFDDNAKAGAERGAESRWYEDWGEQLTGQHWPVVVVLDVRSAALSVLAPDDDVSLGQARWRCYQGAITVVAVAWENTPRRLGLIYCTNRASHVRELSLSGGVGRRLSGDGALSCRSPRVSPDGSTVLWLESAAGGPHHAGARLMRRHLDGGPSSVVLDLVDVPKDGYAGLYLQRLPTDCWLSDRQVCLSTPCGVHQRTITVNVCTGELRHHDSTDVTVLHACERLVAGVRSSLLRPPQLVVRRPGDATFTPLTESRPASDATVRALIFNREEPADLATVPYTGLLVTPAGGGPPAPLIVFPHGGPHTVITDSWSAHVALFSQLGLAVLMVNYRGSAGAGERMLHALPGRIGALDVGDCVHAAQHVLQLEPGLDAERVGAYGGSHGGFLVTHLSGQHPGLVKAVAARNPVCDVAAMMEGTDISDWNYVESGAAYEPTPTPARLAAMLEHSPMSHVATVRAPTLLLLGSADRRVVPYQALHYHHALRARGVPTEVRMYDDCHPLAKPGVNGDVMVHAAVWLCEKLGHTPVV